MGEKLMRQSALREDIMANASTGAGDGEFLVNTTTDGWQYDSSVTALGGGAFVVTWTEGASLGHSQR